jgi:hypothetical protein
MWHGIYILPGVTKHFMIMRRYLLLSTAMLIAAGGTFAPKKSNTFASHISLGPVVSLGHSWVSNVAGDRDFKFSPALGIGLVYSRDEHLGFGAQLLVSHEGYKQEFTFSNNETADVTVNPVYVRLPLHVIYFFGNHGDRVRPKIYVGPSVAMRVDETHHYSDSQMKPAEGTPGAADQFSRFDAGLSAGLGANVRLSKLTWLNLDAGYYHGLVDVIDATTASNSFNGNRNLRLNVGLMWGL